MPAAHGRSSAVFLNAYNVSAFLSSFDSTKTVDTAEVTTFGSTSKAYVTGLRDGTITLHGYFDGGAGALDELMSNILLADTTNALSICEEGAGAIGNRCTVAQVLDTSYQITGSISDAVGVTAEFQADGTGASGAYRGIVLGALGTYSNGQNTTSVNNGAASSNGIVANLHLVTAGASTTVNVQHSTNNSTWVTLASFTASSTITSQTIATTGTVHQWLRVNVVTSGSPVMVVTAARK